MRLTIGGHITHDAARDAEVMHRGAKCLQV